MNDETPSTPKSQISRVHTVSQAKNLHQPAEDFKASEEPESDIPETQNSKQENIRPQNDHENEVTEAQAKELNEPEPDSDLPCQELHLLHEDNEQESCAAQDNTIVSSHQSEVIS